MDPRFKKINKLLTEYALGNFNKKLRLSNKFDEVDSFISCINMLGEELRETTISKNYFNNIFNSVSDMIFVLDLEGKIQNTSPSVQDTLNYPISKFINKSIDSIEVNKGKSIFFHISQHLKTNRKPIEIETSFKNKDGEIIQVHSSTVFLYDEKKCKIGYLLVAKDLSTIKEIEFSLNESEKKYKKLFEVSSDCIFITDKNGDFLDINLAGYNLFKAGSSSIASFNLFSIFTSAVEKAVFLKEIKQNKSIVNFSTQIKCADESLIECLISANIIENNKNKIIGYSGTIKDISKQKEIENLVFKAIVNTQEAERRRFAKDIHDSIGQQLSAIKFYIGTSVSITEDEKQKKLLIKANEGLVSALADIRNVCFNLMPKTLENFGLAESINELCKQTEVKEKLEFDVEVQEGFPSLNKQLEISVFRVVQEFINNALKHSDADNIFIELHYDEKCASICMRDNGKGFSYNAAIKNGGMGLRNVHSRLQPYNGEVSIESAKGKGTKYTISIPLMPDNIC